jgi:hypothetical protein
LGTPACQEEKERKEEKESLECRYQTDERVEEGQTDKTDHHMKTVNVLRDDGLELVMTMERSKELVGFVWSGNSNLVEDVALFLKEAERAKNRENM